MKRASYRHAVAWIAEVDNAGASDACDAEIVHGYITVGLVADLFGVEQERVARDVVRARKRLGIKPAAP